MVDELDFETYLLISPKKFGIYLFNKKNLNNLYKDELKFNNKKDYIDLDNLDKFLENNVFKIEKLSGTFIKKISLITESNENSQLSFGIKKKYYEDIIRKKLLQNIITDAKDLFRENYQNYHIMHMLITRYYENGKYHLSYNDEFSGDYLCIEFQFKHVSNNFISEINKVLRKYHIELAGCIDGLYIKNYFAGEEIEFSEMIYKIQNGYNENEVKIISKNSYKKGFFEKFFQLFS